VQVGASRASRCELVRLVAGSCGAVADSVAQVFPPANGRESTRMLESAKQRERTRKNEGGVKVGRLRLGLRVGLGLRTPFQKRLQSNIWLFGAFSLGKTPEKKVTKKVTVTFSKVTEGDSPQRHGAHGGRFTKGNEGSEGGGLPGAAPR